MISAGSASKLLKFTKMQGAGNDFVVVDAVNQQVALDAHTAKRIADRHFGVGCDQILLIERPRTAGTDFYYRIYNADGEEVQHCGNGARCFLRYVHDKGLTDKLEIRVETLAGIIVPKMESDGRVTVNMGTPEFEPARIPFLADARAQSYRVEVAGETVEISAISMGNPHAVQIVDSVERAPVSAQGPLIERHPRFPQRVNAGYMEVIDRHQIKLRVYERGAGETLACGTGACAAVVAGITRGYLDSPVNVHTRGGVLSVAWSGGRGPVLLTGDAETVFEGAIEI